MTQDVGQLLGFLTLEGVDAKLLTQLSTFGVPLKSLHHTIAYHPCLSQCFFFVCGKPFHCSAIFGWLVGSGCPIQRKAKLSVRFS